MSSRAEKLKLARLLLKNEQEFNSLFSSMEEHQYFTLFRNHAFADDPVFNHFVLKEAILEDEAAPDQKFLSVIEELKKCSSSLGFRTTVFSESIWKKGPQFQKLAISQGFKVSEKMEIFSKTLEPRNIIPRSNEITVSETKDFEAWNRLFISSFQIPPSWNDELIRREKEIVQNQSVTLFLAKETSSSEHQGCLLSFVSPEDLMGIYCVGTDPRSRKRGIAKALMSFAEEKARRIGCSRTTLQTVTSDGAGPMYKKMGYIVEFDRNIMWNPLSG